MPPKGLFFSMRASLAKLSPMHLVSAIKRPREEVGGVGNFGKERGETAVSFWLVAGSPGKAEERLVPFGWQLHRERRERFRQQKKKGEGCASKGE